MRKIMGGFAVSLDGYIDGPGGKNDWMIMDKDFDFAEHLKQFDTFFMGRKSYEIIRKASHDPFPEIKKFVFSNSIKQVEKEYALVKDPVNDFVNTFRKQRGRNIAIYGGAELFTSLLSLGLVDEVMLSVMPVVLGEGKSMISQPMNRTSLKLLESRKFQSGVVMLHYKINDQK